MKKEATENRLRNWLGIVAGVLVLAAFIGGLITHAESTSIHHTDKELREDFMAKPLIESEFRHLREGLERQEVMIGKMIDKLDKALAKE